MLSSNRAEPNRKVRHVAEYHHLEAELPSVCFDDPLNNAEYLVCTVVDNILAKPVTRLSR